MRSIAVAAVISIVLGCRSTANTSVPTSSAVPAPTRQSAGVHFVQGMISHHAQALEMTRLVAGRSARPAIQLLAERIDVSQKDEIALMRRWLASKGASVPEPDAHLHAAMGHGNLMPGMLTAQELDLLAAKKGAEFDRLFLQFMIRHHEGALRMVSDLFGSPGSQDAQLFSLASDIDADQRAEIARMQTLQRTIQ